MLKPSRPTLVRPEVGLLARHPALERAIDDSRSKAALLLLTKHRTPDGIRRAGEARIHASLKKDGARSRQRLLQLP